MSIIKVKAICLIRDNHNELLLAEGYDSTRGDYYYRPLGGTVEFGETTEQTIIRELMEELKAVIKNVVLLHVIENIFTLEGKLGHEIVYIYEAEFCNLGYYSMDTIYANESNGEKIKCVWISQEDCLTGKYRLVPEKLITKLVE